MFLSQKEERSVLFLVYSPDKESHHQNSVPVYLPTLCFPSNWHTAISDHMRGLVMTSPVDTQTNTTTYQFLLTVHHFHSQPFTASACSSLAFDICMIALLFVSKAQHA